MRNQFALTILTETYRVVFDCRTSTYSIFEGASTPIAMSVVFILIAGASWKLRSQMEPRERSTAWRAALCGAIVTGVSALYIVSNNRNEYRQLATALSERRARVVEGAVEEFIPQHADGHPIERFRVGSIHYSYSASDVGPAFRAVAGKGGPIRSGLHVRVYDVDGRIARLEIVD